MEAIRQSIPPYMHRPRVLEIGPGTGALTKALQPMLAQHGGTYTAIERSQQMYDQCRANVPGINLILGTWEDLRTEHEWDIIVARMVLRHAHSPIESFLSWSQMLNRGGILAIGEGPPPSVHPEVRAFYASAMTIKHGSPRAVLHASTLVEMMLRQGMTTTSYERWTHRNSLEQWLSAAKTPERDAELVRAMHLAAPDAVREAYAMTVTDDKDVLMRWRHCVVVGRAT